MTTYCPSRGDVILLDFNPQSGREQAGLNKEAALDVAYKLRKLDEALGDMDIDMKSGAAFADPTMIVNDCGCEFDPDCKRCFPFRGDRYV